jgi:retinol dehydrogenase 12
VLFYFRIKNDYNIYVKYWYWESCTVQTISDMSGKTCLVTGATGGIGLVTAQALARAGAEVVIIGRSPEKTAEVARQMQARGGKVEYLLGDLSAQAEVRRLAAEFRQGHNRLDVLVNNAGAFFMKHQVSQDGFEMTFALNHLAYFLLTNLLLDLLTTSAPSRIVNVSSGAHVGGRINLENIQNPRTYSGWAAYSQSKLANIYFTYELARRLQGSGVTVNALHPGFVATNFGRSNGGLFNPLFRLFQIGAISPEEGAKTSIYLATSPEVEGVTGKYFDKCKPISSSPVSYDQDMARDLWDLSTQLTHIPETMS